MNEFRIFQIIPNLDLAGAETMVENLSIQLSRFGLKVYIISLYNVETAISDRLRELDIQVIFLNKKKGFDINIIFDLIKLINKYKPNVIHSHLRAINYAMIAAITTNCDKRFHTVHNIASKEAGKIQRIINYAFYKYFKVIPISISPTVKRTILDEYNLSDENVPIIYNGIDLSKCIPKYDYNLNSNFINILHIGRFSEQKNHELLINSFEIVHNFFPNTILQLIGIGELEEKILEKVKKAGLKSCVIFLRQQSNVFDFLNKADIFILPSLWEGMPISLIEAMGTGLPIITTNVGGISDIIIDKKTGIISKNDTNDLAQCILNLINDPDMRYFLGSSAREDSLQFSALEMAKKYISIYDDYK